MGDAGCGPRSSRSQRSLVVAIDLTTECNFSAVSAHNNVLGFKLRISLESRLDLFLNVGRLNAGFDRNMVDDTHHAEKLADVGLGGMLLIVPVDVAAQRD